MRIEIKRINDIKGKGVVAKEKIHKNSIICIYFGEMRPHLDAVEDDSVVSIGWSQSI